MWPLPARSDISERVIGATEARIRRTVNSTGLRAILSGWLEALSDSDRAELEEFEMEQQRRKVGFSFPAIDSPISKDRSSDDLGREQTNRH